MIASSILYHKIWKLASPFPYVRQINSLKTTPCSPMSVKIGVPFSIRWPPSHTYSIRKAPAHSWDRWRRLSVIRTKNCLVYAISQILKIGRRASSAKQTYRHLTGASRKAHETNCFETMLPERLICAFSGNTDRIV